MNRMLARPTPMLLAAALVACGGGGGGDPAPTPPPTNRRRSRSARKMPTGFSIKRRSAQRQQRRRTSLRSATKHGSINNCSDQRRSSCRTSSRCSRLIHRGRISRGCMKTVWTSGSGTRCMRRISSASASRSRFRRSWSSRRPAPPRAPAGPRATTTCSRRNAFGNFRKLLEDVTLHLRWALPSMRGNQQAQHRRNIPDENYPRELMQLFTIGLVELNPDGSRCRRAGKLIPTYDQDGRRGIRARLHRLDLRRRAPSFASMRDDSATRSSPMQAYAEHHATGAKRLLSYPGAIATASRPGRPPSRISPTRSTTSTITPTSGRSSARG